MIERAVWVFCVEAFGAFRAFFEDERKSRIKGWRLNRRSARSLLPAVRAVDEVFSAGGCGVCLSGMLQDWRLSPHSGKRFKGLKRALSRFGGIMSRNENRLNFRMTDETASKIERWYQEDNCRSKNEFIEKAVNFYAPLGRAAIKRTNRPRSLQALIK